MTIQEQYNRWKETTLKKSLDKFKERKERFETSSGIEIPRLALPADEDPDLGQERQGHVARSQVYYLKTGQDVGGDVPVRQGHSLGSAGGSRGVDEGGGVAGGGGIESAEQLHAPRAPPAPLTALERLAPRNGAGSGLEGHRHLGL